MAEHCARHARHWIWCGPCRRAKHATPHAPQPAPRSRGRAYDEAVDAELPAAAVLVTDLMASAESEPLPQSDSPGRQAGSGESDQSGTCSPAPHHTPYTPDPITPATSSSTAGYAGHTAHDPGGGGSGHEGGSTGGSDASSCGGSIG